MVSHYSTAVLEGATILWQTSDGQSGSLPLSKTPGQGEVATEGTLQFKAPQVDAAAPEFLRLQLVNAAGTTLAQNRYRFAVYPQPAPNPGITVAIHDPLNQLQYLRSGPRSPRHCRHRWECGCESRESGLAIVGPG